MEVTKSKRPGMAWTSVEVWPFTVMVKCASITPTTIVIEVVQIKKTSLYFNSFVGENSNMKL